MPNNRDISVDIAKGIGIILVVWAHTRMSNLIFSFHMPLFFILSGFFVKYEPTKFFLYKKFRTLFIPLCVFYAFSLITKIPFQYFFKSPEDVIEKIKNGSMFRLTTVDVTLWYIVCLIEILCLFHFIEKYISNSLMKIICVFVIFAFGWLMVEKSVSLPFYLIQTFLCLPLLYLGRIYNSKLKSFCGIRLFLASLSVFVISYICFRPESNLLNLHFKNIWSFLIPAISGSFMVIGLSQILTGFKSNIFVRSLSSTGVMSLFIMALSEDVRMVSPLCKWAGIVPYGDVMVETALVVLITYMVGRFVDRKFPYLWHVAPFVNKG